MVSTTQLSLISPSTPLTISFKCLLKMRAVKSFTNFICSHFLSFLSSSIRTHRAFDISFPTFFPGLSIAFSVPSLVHIHVDVPLVFQTEQIPEQTHHLLQTCSPAPPLHPISTNKSAIFSTTRWLKQTLMLNSRQIFLNMIRYSIPH